MRSIGIALSVLVVFWSLGVSYADTQKIRILDGCDPATFNADPPVGPGLGEICQKHPNDGVTFEEFAELLTPAAFGHPAWRFNAPYLEIESGDKVRVTNRGGEDHTFTEVPDIEGTSIFGGGRFDGINTPLGLTALPQCAEELAPVIHPGDSIQLKDLSEGTHYFQCCIHPWMHAIIEVEAGDKSHKHHGHD
jgi:plastocyanin